MPRETRYAAGDGSEVEGTSEGEGSGVKQSGVRGFPLQSPPLLVSIASMQVWRVSGDITVSMGIRSVIPSLLASLFGVPKEKNKNKIK